MIFQLHKRISGDFLAEVRMEDKNLNALSLELTQQLKSKLLSWKQDSSVRAVFIHSNNKKAFSAGGDLKDLYRSMCEAEKEGEDLGKAVEPFFKTEYMLDRLLYDYPKPVVAWGEGLIMGGGLGLFLACSHPILTESTLLSMPEIKIGFFPDVGGSYFLSRLPDNLGLYLALTAYRLQAREASYLQLSDLYFLNNKKQQVFQFLIEGNFKNSQDLSSKLLGLTKDKPPSQNWLESNKETISSLIDHDNFFDVYKSFENWKPQDDQAQEHQNTFLKSSLFSGAVIFEQMKRARQKNLDEIFEMELVLAKQMARRGDFKEGIRALIIDKTHQPKWKLSNISSLSWESVREVFINS